MDGYESAGCYFYSNFDSGNLHKVEYIPPDENAPVQSQSITGKNEVPNLEFNLWTKPDCGGTEFENGNRTWFYFGVRCTIPSALIKLNLVDLNKQAKLYSQGMGPVYKIVPGKLHWDRICDKPTYNFDNNVFTLSFKIKTPENVLCTTYLAFTYPYTYHDLQHRLELLDKRHKSDEPLSKDDIYYVRECLCHSLDGRRVDLITISAYNDISSERETSLTNLFPEKSVPRPFRFVNKKVIFVSARVHPGETPSSFVLNGLLNLLMSREDAIASILRRNYVFKLIPCLNPDGVARGHYRTDTRGVNLNRVYLNPQFELHPPIYAARSLIKYYHYGYEKEDCFIPEENQGENNLLSEVSHMTLLDKNNKNVLWCSKCKTNFITQETIVSGQTNCSNCGETVEVNDNLLTQGDCVSPSESGLFLYLDMHGHASKKGIFMYGNHFDDVESSVKCMLLPKIMSINNHNFHFTACNFTERNMYVKDKRDGMSKEGSGRVAVYKLTGLVQSYTLECNYNTGRLVNILPPTIKESVRNQGLLIPPKYNPHIFEEVGKAIGYSILDMISQNPFTRLPHSEYHSLNGLREWLRLRCSNDLGETRKSPNKLKIRHSASLHAQGKAVRSVIVKTRSLSKYAPKKVNIRPLRPTKMSKKEKFPAKEVLPPQPSCSHVGTSTSTSRTKVARASKSQQAMQTKTKIPEKPKSPSVNHIVKNIQNTGAKSKFKTDLKTGQAGKEKVNEDLEKIKLKEICFVKDTDGKKVIAKYESDTCEDDNLIVAWSSKNNKAQVFTHKSRMPAFLSSVPLSGAEAKQRSFRVHNFHKSKAPFSKVLRNKRIFKRLASTSDTSKIKKKLLKKKSRKELE